MRIATFNCNSVRSRLDTVLRWLADYAPDVLCLQETKVQDGEFPADAFRLPDVPGVAVVPRLAEGTKCARSWKISLHVGDDPKYPDVSPRDAQALRERDALYPPEE